VLEARQVGGFTQEADGLRRASSRRGELGDGLGSVRRVEPERGHRRVGGIDLGLERLEVAAVVLDGGVHRRGGGLVLIGHLARLSADREESGTDAEQRRAAQGGHGLAELLPLGVGVVELLADVGDRTAEWQAPVRQGVAELLKGATGLGGRLVELGPDGR